MFENEDLFEAVTEMAASALEGNHITIDGAGGAAAGEFVIALYKALADFERCPCSCGDSAAGALDGESRAGDGESRDDEDCISKGDADKDAGADADAGPKADAGAGTGIAAGAGADADGASHASFARLGRYELFRDTAGEYRFRLKAANGEIIAVSEGYRTKRDALSGIESVRKNAASEVVNEV